MRVAALQMSYIGFVDDIGLQLHSCRCMFEQCTYTAAVSIPDQCSIQLQLKLQTAGFGVFAGRSYKQDEAVLQSWMTMFLPRNIAQFQGIHNYAFEYNETHLALDLGYGSMINHHESANTKAMRTSFKVRMGFRCANHNIEKYAACTHTRYTCT